MVAGPYPVLFSKQRPPQQHTAYKATNQRTHLDVRDPVARDVAGGILGVARQQLEQVLDVDRAVAGDVGAADVGVLGGDGADECSGEEKAHLVRL